jgi:predicted N-formylglutamate amidohydrolase
LLSPSPDDIGTEKFAMEFAKRTGSPALLARFSRLLIDVNRPLDSDTLIRDKCDSKPVAIGTNVSAEDKQRRIDLYWTPYRQAFDRLLDEYKDTEMVLGIHSFTPNYEGSPRTVEIGVLCTNEHIATAEKINAAFIEAGYKSKINEPWTGDICDVMKTGNKKGKIGIVVEFRQDLVVIPKWKTEVEKVLMTTLYELDVLR